MIGKTSSYFQWVLSHLSFHYSHFSLTHSAAPSHAFESGVKKRRSGSTLSKPQHLCWGVEGLTYFFKLYPIPRNFRPKSVRKMPRMMA